MMKRQSSCRSPRSARALASALALAWLAFLFCVATLDARAASTCTIAFPAGTAPTLVAGEPDGVRGAEWNDATVLTSGDACFSLMQDIIPMTGGMITDRVVRVYSKRFTRGGTSFVGFFFEVPDRTDKGPCPNQELCNGERIVLQFDSNISRGAQLAGGNPLFSLTNDYQLVFNHKWTATGNNVTAKTWQASERIAAGGELCSPPEWTPVSLGGVNEPKWFVRNDLVGGGYTAEIEVPLPMLGFVGMPPASTNVGFALAVVNDLGNDSPMACGANAVCDGFATSFPNSPEMTVTNASNPLVACHGNWTVPNEWGTGTFGLAPGAVTIDRTPEYWNTSAIAVKECNAAGGVYQWYKDKPCTARIEARLDNNTGATQTRNILFLWSSYGTGDPATYKVVALLENQSVPVGDNVGPFAVTWSDPPYPVDHHPCMRAYILPPSFLPTFTKAQILAITSRDGPDGLNAMVAAYGLGTNQWAQKNISQSATQNVCTTCPVASLRDVTKPTDEAARTSSSPASPPSSSPASPQKWADLAERARNTKGEVVILPANYTPDGASPAASPQQTNPDDKRPPIVQRPGTEIVIAPREMERYRRDYVIVQVRTFGFDTKASKEPRYNFIENMGGILLVVPVEVMRKLIEVPFHFEVSNSFTERTVFHQVSLYTGAGAQDTLGTQVGLDTSPSRYAVNETRTVNGFVRVKLDRGVGGGTTGTTDTTGGGEFKRWGLSLHAGASIPHSDFGDLRKTGPNFGVDLEYRFNKYFSLEGIYTFHRFGGERLGPFGPGNVFIDIPDLNLHQISVNGKIYGGTSPVRPFFNLGGGAYKFDPGEFRGGVNLGGGLQYDVTPKFAVEGAYNFHSVFGIFDEAKFSTVQAGVRFRF